MSYLKEDQYYINQYDLDTIKECLRTYWTFRDNFDSHKQDKQFKAYSDEKFNKESHKAISIVVNVTKIQRYKLKAEAIREWMEKDRKVQERFDNAVPPDETYCTECFSRTKVVTKDFLRWYEPNSQVLFMFECVKCKKRQSLYEDGSKYQYKPPQCPKCSIPLNHKSKKTKDILVTKYTCPKCDYKDENKLDFKKSDEEWEKNQEKDRKLLQDYRKDFCYEDKVGREAVLCLDNMIRFSKEVKEREAKEKDPVFQKAKQLKILKIGQLKELLEKTIEKESYLDLAFAKPEMGQFVIIDFSVNDMKESRGDYDSKKILKKLIEGILVDTNWRLMSDGVSYRLGILTGRLKAYEREEDLMKLVKPEK